MMGKDVTKISKEHRQYKQSSYTSQFSTWSPIWWFWVARSVVVWRKKSSKNLIRKCAYKWKIFQPGCLETMLSTTKLTIVIYFDLQAPALLTIVDLWQLYTELCLYTFNWNRNLAIPYTVMFILKNVTHVVSCGSFHIGVLCVYQYKIYHCHSNWRINRFMGVVW